MIGAGLFIKKLFSEWGMELALAFAVAIVLLLTFCTGKQSEQMEQLEREADTQREVNSANETAAGRRVDDGITLERQKEELADAIEDNADPAELRARRGCLILRQQGRDTSNIPACRGFEGRPGAGIP